MTQTSRMTAVPDRDDFVIPQNWSRYTLAEHHRWDDLVARQKSRLDERACSAFLEAQTGLRLSHGGIPHFGRLSERLHKLTGWQVVAVPHLVPDAVFFNHLAHKRFPAGAFIRSSAQFDYIQEPDVFHDVYGHVPLLANPAFAEFMQAYGEIGLEAASHGALHRLARLYWYTVEFGLLETPEGLRIYGAGILSSPAESIFALEDASPHRVRFDLRRVMSTNYHIDDFQQIYFVIKNFDQLRHAMKTKVRPELARFAATSHTQDLEPAKLGPNDKILTEGTHSYFLTQSTQRS